MIDNKKVLDTILMCNDITLFGDYDMDKLNNTYIDFREWIKRSKKINGSLTLILNLALNMVCYGDKEDIEGYKKFEKCFDFVFNTFKDMRGLDVLDDDINLVEEGCYENQETIDYFVWAARDYKCLNASFMYTRYCGKVVVINDKEHEIKIKELTVDLIDKITKKVVYEDVIGFKKDLVNDKVNIIYSSFDWIIDHDKLFKNNDKNKFIISFLDRSGSII